MGWPFYAIKNVPELMDLFGLETSQAWGLNLSEVENFHDRPPLEIVIRKFRAAKITSFVAAVIFTAVFVVIWPGSMLSGVTDG